MCNLPVFSALSLKWFNQHFLSQFSRPGVSYKLVFLPLVTERANHAKESLYGLDIDKCDG